MKSTILAVAAILGVATTPTFAQTTPSSDGDTPAVATPETKNPTAPVPGANSFTEAQAKGRIEQAGYALVRGLKLDTQGIWRAEASKGGVAVLVALDYQGNNSSEPKQ